MARVLDTLETEEYRILRGTAADYAARVLAPVAEELDSPSGPPYLDSMNKAAELGVLRAFVAEESGGGGLDDYAFCIALEEMAVESAGAATALLIHNAALAPAIAASGQAGLEAVFDAAFPMGLGYPGQVSLAGGKVSGQIPLAFNAPAASMLTVLARAADGIAVAMVEPKAEGVTITPNAHQMGLRAARAGGIHLASVTPVAVISADDEMVEGLERMLHLGFAAVSTGIARKAFTTAYAYASERYQGGDIIVRHQALRLMLAEMVAGVEMSRAMIKSACEADGLAAALTCRIEATDRALRSATDGVQVHGGYGYMEDYGMERLMRDASWCQIYPRPNQESLLTLLDLVEG